MKKALFILLVLLLPVHFAGASEVSDSTLSRHVPLPIAALGVMSVAEGSVAHVLTPFPGSISSATLGARSTIEADIAQFVPLAFPWAMKACGVTTRSGWGRMAVSQAIGGLIMTGAVESVKNTVASRRPDGDGWNSFPSGHAARAFFGATAAAIELEGQPPWYAVGSYAFATGIAAWRVVDNRHYPCDVVAGAGIGIISAQLGYWIGDAIFGPVRSSQPMSAGRVDDARWRVALQSGMAFPLGGYNVGQNRIIAMPALQSALMARWRQERGFVVGVSVEMLSVPLAIKSPGMYGSMLVAPLNSVGIVIMPGWEWALSRQLAVDASIGGGWFKNFEVQSAGRAVSMGSSTPCGRVEAGMSLRLHGALGCRAAIGYELLSHDITISPSSEYSITTGTSRRVTAGALTTSLAATIDF